jgi:hypothetical protein
MICVLLEMKISNIFYRSIGTLFTRIVRYWSTTRKLIPKSLELSVIRAYRIIVLGKNIDYFLKLKNLWTVTLRESNLQILLDIFNFVNVKNTYSNILYNRVHNPTLDHIVTFLLSFVIC